MKRVLQFLCTLCTIYFAGGYHILVVFPVPSPSHNTLGKGVVDALLNAGHQVTWATSYPITETRNLKIIDLSATRPFRKAINWNEKVKPDISLVREFSMNISRTAITTPALQDAIVHGKFDAVVTEAFFSDVDAGYAAVMKIPWIIFSSVVMTSHFERQLAEVNSIPTVPMLFNTAPVPMGFFDRLYNSFLHTVLVIDHWIHYQSLVSFYESLFAPLAARKGMKLPPFSDAFYNVSVLFINSHPSYAHAISLPPNVVEVGGFHIDRTPLYLPQDLRDILDSSSGAIYFSMGSVLRSAAIPNNTKRELLQVFSKLPFTVLWKFEEQLDNLPKNVHVRPWMPQSSILAHPKIKLFITHGGLLSLQEGLHHGVPLLAIPVYGDQPGNADRAVRAGYALSVSYSATMVPDIENSILKLTTNDSYHTKAKYISKIFRKRVVEPSKLIPHYIELAIESQGAYHLRSKSLLYSWYQRWMLDQAFVILIAVYALFRVVKECVYGFNSFYAKNKKDKTN